MTGIPHPNDAGGEGSGALDPLDISIYPRVFQRHVIGAGMVAMLVNSLEQLARSMLGMVSGLTAEATDALLLGERFGTLARKMRTLQRTQPDDAFIASAVPWMRATARLVDERDQLLHRPVQVEGLGGAGRHMLMPARPTQEQVELNDQTARLVVALEDALADGYTLFIRYGEELRNGPGGGQPST